MKIPLKTKKKKKRKEKKKWIKETLKGAQLVIIIVARHLFIINY